jgi:hypothetical protein
MWWAYRRGGLIFGGAYSRRFTVYDFEIMAPYPNISIPFATVEKLCPILHEGMPSVPFVAF